MKEGNHGILLLYLIFQKLNSRSFVWDKEILALCWNIRFKHLLCRNIDTITCNIICTVGLSKSKRWEWTTNFLNRNTMKWLKGRVAVLLPCPGWWSLRCMVRSLLDAKRMRRTLSSTNGLNRVEEVFLLTFALQRASQSIWEAFVSDGCNSASN